MSDNKTVDWAKYRPATQAVRAGLSRSNEQEHSEAIFATSSFVFESAQQAAARFSYEEEGNVYSRFTNPSVHTFEKRLAVMEGAEACVATASGMAAILSTCMAALKSGDHVIASKSIFGASRLFFSSVLSSFGINTTFVELVDLEKWQSALQDNTRMVFFETPANPVVQLGDIRAISDLAHAYNSEIKVVVDNCFCTPVLQQPLSLGADVVVHSATKFIDGQGRCVGGAVLGEQGFVGEQVFAFMRTAGPTISPFNAWVFSKGLETLPVRMNQSCANAKQVADYLMNQEAVKAVHYPGLDSHPQYELACQQQKGFGAILSFEVEGGQQAAWKLIDQCQLLSITGNLGDSRTTITHPYTTTHARWSDEQKSEVGINQGLIRLSIGLEDPHDIIEDLGF